MRRIKILLFAAFIATSVHAQDVLLDSRDGRSYQIVKIGNQTWMSENLAFYTEISHSLPPFSSDKGKKPEDCYFCAMDSVKYCDKYGVLYTWDAALNACPAGWHLPSEEEFNFLFSNIGGRRKDVFFALTDGGDTGYNAQLGGALLNYDLPLPSFDKVGKTGWYWTSTNVGHAQPHRKLVYFVFLSKVKRVLRWTDVHNSAFSVRCVKNGAVK